MSEPLVLINLFSMPAEMVDDFVGGWEASIAAAKNAPGFRGTRLHRSLDPDAPYPVVNIARWDSVEDWQAAFDKYFSGPGRSDDAGRVDGGWDAVSAHPTLYSVAHVTPDPTASSDAHS
ncbi:antibiotic biosynthesis monooxygenase family protein [Nonomuraea sp. NPDC050022]|uniref:antibiotic biosynthesis monooxygenase family protein n=1 Tax=unclassified Nonomuraea TaxID=2593643 RepID=UPI003403ECEC